MVDTGNAAVVVEDVRKAYGDLKAVDGVSLTVAEGEFFGILGPNGAGKTTTLEIIEGLREPDAGTIAVFVPGVLWLAAPIRLQPSIPHRLPPVVLGELPKGALGAVPLLRVLLGALRGFARLLEARLEGAAVHVLRGDRLLDQHERGVVHHLDVALALGEAHDLGLRLVEP